ncbi:hypothetical protein [Neptunicella sp.]|uniref:hypothetical protein n=1 Tax=Neptunicella sp. TaxID=2125986 RepID=UPI003F68C693
MKINKHIIMKIFLILLGISSLLLAYKDWNSGVGTRRGVDVIEKENPMLFKAEIYKKIGLGVFVIGLALFIKPKD